MNETRGRRPLLALIGPGILVAATGVGAGDLASASLAGRHVGLIALWAVLVGAFLKFVITEGLARWQLATGTTFLEGATRQLGPVVAWIFLPYLFVWSFFVGAALMGACGVTFHAIVPWFDDASHAKVVWGVLHSVAGWILVRLGGFALFERFMSVCIGVMFVLVVVAAITLWPSVESGAAGASSDISAGERLDWIMACVGGVGGTVTVLCYGYWIREQGRFEPGDMKLCRLDLTLGYTMTAVFGVAMVILGSQIDIDQKGAELVVGIADRLEKPLGSVGRWLFLAGAWGAVFSSLLGVWQSVPYLYTDFRRFGRSSRESPREASVDMTRSAPYVRYMTFLATVPALGLLVRFETAQKIYAIFGAFFVPLLAVALLLLNSRSRAIGDRLRSGALTRVALVAAIAVFLAYAIRTVLLKL